MLRRFAQRVGPAMGMVILLQVSALAQGPSLSGPVLAEAVLCEQVDAGRPLNPAVLFSIPLGSVSCFTLFDPVPSPTVVYHLWFRRDALRARVKLALQPPRWSTFSRMVLRGSEDVGPWRVEVRDENDKFLSVLRFSVTE